MKGEYSVITYLKSLTFGLTNGYLKIVRSKKVTKFNQTGFYYRPFEGIYFIKLNLTQIDKISSMLVRDRGFDKNWVLIEVLLHEIAHFKKFDKNRKKYGKIIGAIVRAFRSESEKQQEEDLCDRYAHYCVRILVRELNKWIILNNTLSNN